MQLSDIRSEILQHGFDPVYFSTSRINTYINDGLRLICRRVDYYVNENVYAFSTTNGTASYVIPYEDHGGQLAKVRSLFDTVRNLELTAVFQRDIDRSIATTGAPTYYAMNGLNLSIYPTPDGVYSLNLRYWQVPPLLVNDTDVPSMPSDWHHLLWEYGCWMCYEAEDDAAQGPLFKARFEEGLAEFAEDVKYPNSDMPNQARGMWEEEPSLVPNSSWVLYGGY